MERIPVRRGLGPWAIVGWMALGGALALAGAGVLAVAWTARPTATRPPAAVSRATAPATSAPAGVAPATAPASPAEVPASDAPSVREARVTYVVDGDTVHVDVGGVEEKVRLFAVDTPESTTQHEPFGEEASAYARAQLDGRTVWLEAPGWQRDRYGRLLAYVWLERPTSRDDAEVRAKMFNARLLSGGYAEVYRDSQDRTYMRLFHALEAEARAARLGRWAQ